MSDTGKVRLLLKRLYQCSFIVFSIIISYSSAHSQDSLEKSRVLIENADNWINEIIEGDTSVQYLRENVRIVHDSLFMFCDSAFIKSNQLSAVGEVIIIQDDTINIFSDSLYYDGDNKFADLYYNVVLETNGKQLFTNHLNYDVGKKVAVFQDTAILKKSELTLSSISGIYNVKNKTAYFYEQVTIIDGEMELKTDSLYYDTDQDKAYFLGPTYITQSGNRIYCEGGHYDLTLKRAYFSNDPYIVQDDSRIEGDYIKYVGQDSVMVVEGGATIRDSTSQGKAEKIILNEVTNEIELIGNSEYTTEDKRFVGEYIYFDKEGENLRMEGDCYIHNSKGYIKGDTVDYNKTDDFGVVQKNAVWLDTIENLVIESDIFEYKEASSFLKAFTQIQKPIFSKLIDGDTLFLSADTLISESPKDTSKYLYATNDVRIFKSNLQAVCDSLYYSDLDSIFSLYKNPTIWSDSIQFQGDTLKLVTKNDQLTDIISRSNAFVIIEDTIGYYNQIKAKNIHGYLNNDTLYKMNAFIDAESVFLVKDDEGYVGPNYTQCENVVFLFDAGELSTVHYYEEPTNKMTPMKDATSQNLRLSGFKWDTTRRPKSKSDLRVRRSPTGLKDIIITGKKPQDEFEEMVKDAIFKGKPQAKRENKDKSKK